MAAVTASYARLVTQEANQAGLLALGRTLYGWLDGGERWLERLLAAAEPPLVVEFRSLANPDAMAAAFKLPVGAVSDPITTDNGTVVFKVVEKKEVTHSELATDKDKFHEAVVNARRTRF